MLSPEPCRSRLAPSTEKCQDTPESGHIRQAHHTVQAATKVEETTTGSVLRCTAMPLTVVILGLGSPRTSQGSSSRRARGPGPRAAHPRPGEDGWTHQPSVSAVLVAESPQLGGVQHQASQDELTALLDPLDEPYRLRDVRSEMEKVGVPDVPTEPRLVPGVSTELVPERVHESVGAVVDRMCADHDCARRECHSDQVQLDRLDLSGRSAHGKGVPLDHLVISRGRFAIPLEGTHCDVQGVGDPRSEMSRAGECRDLIHRQLQPHGRSLVRPEHDTHRPPAAFNRWGVTLVQTLLDQWRCFGKEPIKGLHAPHFSPSTLTTFQSRVVATTPPRSIRALVSIASCDGCASHMYTSRPATCARSPTTSHPFIIATSPSSGSPLRKVT